MEVDGQPPRPSAYTLETIPFAKLLHHMKREDLVEALGPGTYAALQQQAASQGESFTSKYLKKQVASDPELSQHVRGTDLGSRAFAKYQANLERITSPATAAKSREVRKAMAEPRQSYMGCIATKVSPADIRNCTENYDREEYQGVSLVPSAALRESAYRKTGNPALVSPAMHISDLPRGLKQYISEHPEEYEDYMEERKAEVEFLKSAHRNARRAWYRQRERSKVKPENGSQTPKRRRDDDEESIWSSTS